MIKRFLLDEDGQTLVEYGLLISLLALIVVAGVSIFGRGVRENLFNNANANLNVALHTSTG